MTTESITCPRCGMTSYNPNDVREGYCGNCHGYVTKTGKVLTDADIQALADEAERGYDVSHLIGKPQECRAKRWKGTPLYDGPHKSHLFTYGPNGMYTGNCAGRD